MVARLWRYQYPDIPMYHFSRKLANLKAHLVPWAKETFGNVASRISQCTSSLSAIQNALNLDPSSLTLLQAEVNYRHQLSELHWIEESRAQQQSRIRWLKEGDANTKFFHASVKARRARNTICNLEDNGNTINDNPSISNLFLNRFKLLYNKHHNCVTLPEDILQKSISTEDNLALCSMASMDELSSIIKALNTNRALGIDGFNGAFLKATWHVIAGDLLAAVNNFLRSGRLLAQVNHIVIYLIPKKVVPMTVAVSSDRPLQYDI